MTCCLGLHAHGARALRTDVIRRRSTSLCIGNAFRTEGIPLIHTPAKSSQATRLASRCGVSDVSRVIDLPMSDGTCNT